MVSVSYLRSQNIDTLFVCGSVPAKNRFVRDMILREYGSNGNLHVDIADANATAKPLDGSQVQDMNSAKGAAMIVKDATQPQCTGESVKI